MATLGPQKMQNFIERISRLRIPGEIGCPECGGPLNEGNGFNRECLNCGETWPVYKLDEWAADEAFDHQNAIAILISDARELLRGTEGEEVAPRAKIHNIDREERAGHALRAYPGYDPSEEGDIEETFVDLISDLLHLARSLDIEPDYVINLAQIHYDAEVEEESLTKKEEGEHETIYQPAP